MLRRDRQLRTQLLQLKDAALFALALWLAHAWRAAWPDLFPWFQFSRIESFDQFVWMYLVLIPGAPLILESQGFYQRPLFCSRRVTAWLLLKSCALITLSVILMVFLLKSLNARSVVIQLGMIGFLLIYASEELLHALYRSQFGQMGLRRRAILVGTVADTVRTRKQLQGGVVENLEIVADVDINESTIQELIVLLHKTAANTVVVNAGHTYFGQVEKAIQACEVEGVETWLIADFFQTRISRTSFDDLAGRPVLVFRSAPESSWQGFAKMLLDIVLSAILLVVLAPALLLIAWGIRRSSPGPVLFRQERAGLHGRPFTMLKFRSMVSDAEQRKEELAALNEMNGPVFKVSNDPRITGLGAFLRKWSLDELPQLVNVLRGEMSLVGPRPLPVDEVARFDDPAHRRRLSVKPGLTCLWQVSGRNNVRDFREWVRLDLQYIDNWSLWLDLKILWRTVPAVVAGTGAK